MATTIRLTLRFFAVAFFASWVVTVSAQEGVTFHHDAAVMNQFTVQETGLGNLTPNWYYYAFHNNYQNEASARNKLTQRTLTSGTLFGEEPMSERIDSALTSRAKIEALNIADRVGGLTDLAWQMEREKIENKQAQFRSNVNQILFRGGTNDDYLYWNTIYNAVDCGLRIIRDAYLPNSQRQKQYLAIYKDLVLKNNQLVDCLCLWSGLKEVKNHTDNAAPAKPNPGDIARSCYGRWKVAMAGGGGISGGGVSGGISGE